MTDYNYYKVGGSLEYQHPTYVVRKADFELYEGLKNGEFCYVLNSRQMGKSSLRVQMMKKLKEQGFKCASIDMTRIGSHVTPAEWYAGVVSELLRGFGLTRKVNFSIWWRDREMLPPLQRLSDLIEDVLLAESSQKLVIFIDEIDSIIKIKFKEDFFAFIRACYNQRVDNPEYNRLTFCLLGVATPSDLIEDRNLSTPFNIGRAIELTGFQLHEATPLAQGLAGKTPHPQALMREVLAWTGGQPFLTQKVCKLILNAEEMIPDGNETVWVENLVRSRLIENWETQDEPEHLRTIRDRILWSPRKGQLLQLYQQILQSSFAPPYQGGDGGVKAKDVPEHMELRLSGLVVKQQGKLRVYNRIYASVFNQSWVENALAEAGSLPQTAETPTHFKLEIPALEQAAADALQQFESQQIKALISAMQAGQILKALVKDGCPLQDYPTIKPLFALETILDNIRERNFFNTHQDMVYGICFSTNGQHLATVGDDDDGTVKLWNLWGQQQGGWKGHHGKVYNVCFSPDGRYLATAGQDGTAKLWTLTGRQLAEFYGQRWVYSVSFSPDGQLIATAGVDGTARLWNLSGQQLAQFNGHHLGVWGVSFSPDGQLLATAGVDGIARLWNLAGQQLAQCDGHQGEIWDVSFSPDGQRIATAGADGTARLWSLSGQQLAQLNGHQDWVRSAIFSPDGQCVATAAYDGRARLWNLSGQQLAQLNGHRGAILGIRFSPDGQHLVTAGLDGTARLWDLSQKYVAQWNAHQGTVYCVTFTFAQRHLFTVGADGTIRLWNRSGKQLAQLDDPNGWVRSASFSPGMHYLVTAGADGKVRLWRVTWQLSNTDLESIISVSDPNNRLWEIKNLPDQNLGNCNYQTTFWYEFQYSTWVNSVNCSPGWQGVDTERIATAGADGTVCIWNLTGHQLAQWNTNQGELKSLSFHPDGQRLATVGVEGTVYLWDLSGHHLADWHTHQGRVTSVTFSPDGQIVATAGESGTIKLWTISGQLLAEIKGHQGCVRSVSFCGSGKLIATAGDEGTVQLWRVEGLDELLARGCDWLKDYFVTHPEALEKLEICQNRFKSIEAGKNLDRATDAQETISDRAATPKQQTTSLPQHDELQAIAQLSTPLELSPGLDSDPKTEVRKLAAKTLVDLFGEILSRQGDIEKAVAAYAEAQTLDPTLEIPASVGNNLCWWGSLWGHAAEVMDACETAVALEPENGKFRDSRGLARALTGNMAGAIEDFQAFVDWTDNEERRLKRQRWIEFLRAGENPFTEEEIESLFNEYNVAGSKALEEFEVRQDQLSSVEANRNLPEVGEDEDVAIVNFQSLAQTSNTTSKHILWVDDKPANIANEIAQLKHKGLEITEARSTAQAMQILVSSGLSFNAIISDMSRTEEGEYRPNAGISLIKAVREAGIHLPILIYTTLDLYARTINEVVAAGGNGATMSAEELFAWLRDYTNSVRIKTN